jgi:hypothetical protein
MTAWKPTTRQLETIADFSNARMPAEAIARILGIPEAQFRAWTARLVAARELDLEPFILAPALRPSVTAPSSQAVAEGSFAAPQT